MYREIFGHLLQALVYAVAARELGLRWQGYAIFLGVAAFLQGVGAIATALQRRRWVQGAAAGSVVIVLAIYGEVLAQVWMLNRAFGSQTAEAAAEPLGALGLLLPWVLLWPLSRLRGTPGSPLLLLGLLPLLNGAGAPVTSGESADSVAMALWSQWNGGATASVPPGTLVTPLLDGMAGRTLVAEGPLSLPERGSRPALLVEVPVAPVPGGLVRPGTDAPPGVSPWLYARTIKHQQVLPGLYVPAAQESLRYRAALVSEAGTVTLEDGWSPPPPVSPESLRTSVAEGAHHLLANMQGDGRFTYIVKGPSGRSGAGYNYPRHAGTAWFLARAASALKDPSIGAAADGALQHLAQTSESTLDGRVFVLDPSRDDGKAWVGTTALALMGLSLRHNNPVLAEGWLRQVAASVDERGKVRGEMTIRSGVFPDQPANPYGQGQVMLALLLAERAGMNSGKEALDRAEAYLRRDYAGAHPLLVGDEHWMCLVAHALHSVRQSDAADGICAAYLELERGPNPGSALQPGAGGAGGLGEAVAAWADITGSSSYRRSASSFGWLFLRSQYRPADAPLLGRPDRLIGGFRDGPGELDVQIDAVQHIGSAMLGIAVLLGGPEETGSWP